MSWGACCGKRKGRKSNLDDIGRLAGSRQGQHRQGVQTGKQSPPQTASRFRPSVYYVKGSRVPVETLGSDTDRDSRFFSEPQRRDTSVHAQNRPPADLSMQGNPTLLFLLNWQTIPPLARMSVIQRAVRAGNSSMLPVIREGVGPEGGDSIRMGRRPEVAYLNRTLPRTATGHGEGTSHGLLERVAATWHGRRAHYRERDVTDSSQAADDIHTARRMKELRQCRSEC